VWGSRWAWLAGALALTQVLGSLLIGVGARDPLTMIVSSAVLATVAFANLLHPGEARGDARSARRFARDVNYENSPKVDRFDSIVRWPPNYCLAIC
jgi:hypothetical protein